MRATNEVIFRARNLGAVKEHYAGTLGLPVLMDTDSLVGFEAGALNIYFERGEPSGPVFEFNVDNASRAKEQLVSAGCALVEEDESIPRTYLRDPFGLVFNITEA